MAAPNTHGACPAPLSAARHAPPVSTFTPAGRSAPLKDETPGGQAEGFKVYAPSTRRGADSPGALMLGQPVSAAGPTMTSLDLVEFINSQRSADDAELRHDHFMAKVPKVLGEGAPKFRDTYVHPQNGQPYHCYRFPKREACLMAMSYSYDLQALVFDRMTQLEQAAATPALPNFSNPADAARAWADQHEQRERLEAENRQQAEALAIAAPKVGALDRIATATDDAVCLREAAKLAQVPERQFIEFLRVERWIFKPRGGRKWMGYADKEAAGLLELKRVPFTKPDGTEGSDVQVLVTPAGLTKIAELIERQAPHLRKTVATAASQLTQLALPMERADGTAGGSVP